MFVSVCAMQVVCPLHGAPAPLFTTQPGALAQSVVLVSFEQSGGVSPFGWHDTTAQP